MRNIALYSVYSEIFRVGKYDVIPRMNDFIPLYLNFDFMELVLANIEILPYDAKNG